MLRDGPLLARVLSRVAQAEEVVGDAAIDDGGGRRVEVGLAEAAVGRVDGLDEGGEVEVQLVGSRPDHGAVPLVRAQVDEVDVTSQGVVEAP